MESQTQVVTEGEEASRNEPDRLETYAPPPEASDQTIRVLEIPRVRAWSYRGLVPSTPEGLAARRVAFGAGPWLHEPDHVRWTGRDGLARALLRGELGTWAGYVLLPEAHPLFEAEIPTDVLDVHGGVDFDATGRETGFPGAHASVRVLGFHTVHMGDLAPAVAALTGHRMGEYRDVWYAATEAMKLGNQLAAMALHAREASP